MSLSTAYVHTKHFTHQEAVRALVLVRPIVADLISKNAKLLEVFNKLKSLEEGDFQTKKDLESEFETLEEEIRHHWDEITQIGCVMKDAYQGLVDFPSIYRDKELYLCWQYGEGSINYCHDIDGSFKDRRPVPFEMRQAKV